MPCIYVYGCVSLLFHKSLFHPFTPKISYSLPYNSWESGFGSINNPLTDVFLHSGLKAWYCIEKNSLLVTHWSWKVDLSIEEIHLNQNLTFSFLCRVIQLEMRIHIFSKGNKKKKENWIDSNLHFLTIHILCKLRFIIGTDFWWFLTSIPRNYENSDW